MARANGRIGLDFDGTIVLYDEVFHAQAVSAFGMPPGAPVAKDDVRAWMRANVPGEAGWVELQRSVYGLHMDDAAVAPGLPEFLTRCSELDLTVCVVSHKTRWSVAAPPVDLHAAARSWLERSGLLDAHPCLSGDSVFFEPTRGAKLARIGALSCRLFVDDLPEVLADPAFPPGVQRCLYAPAGAAVPAPGVTVLRHWREASALVEPLAIEGT
jgi:hypothetical protein